MRRIEQRYGLVMSTAAAVALMCGACSKQDVSSEVGQSEVQTTTTTGTVVSEGNQTVAVSDAPAEITPVCKVAATNASVITVTSKMGPSASSPTPFSNKLLSQNIDDKNPKDWAPGLDANFTAMLAALKPGLLRFPSGYYGQTYQFATSASGANGFTALTPTFIDQFMALCSAVGAKPLMAINAAGSVSNAQDFVRYVNVTKKYGVTWWHIGNEPDIDGWTDDKNPAQYSGLFNQFAPAMRSVDSSIKIVGGEVMTGADIIGAPFGRDWMTPIVAGTTSNTMDALDWHYYPMDSSQTLATSTARPTFAHLLQEDSADWPPAGLNFAGKVMPILSKIRQQYAPKAEIWIDEFAEDSGKANGGGTGDTMAGAIWASDAIGRYAELGAGAIFKFIFKGGVEHKYTMLDPDNLPRPEYYTYWLYAQQFGDAMVKTVSSQPSLVSVHGGIRSNDGSVRLLVANKSEQSQTVRITFADMSPKVTTQYVLSGGGTFGATQATLNGKQFTGATVAAGSKTIPAVQTADACVDNSVTLKPASVSLLIYYP